MGVFTNPPHTRNGKVRRCAALAKMPDTEKNKICLQDGPSVNDVGVAKDMCRITCDTCPNDSCTELFSDRFSFSINKRLFRKNCNWLQKKVKHGTNFGPFWAKHFSIDKICIDAAQNCPVTCGKCDNLV